MKNQTHTPVFIWLVGHSKSTFVLMCVSFVIFGVLSFNLVMYVAANANYLLTYRWDAIVDGGARQLIEIWGTAFLALGCYLVFKLSEHALIERIAHRPPPVAEIVETDADATVH